ncbi:MAG: transposase [Clostridiaceae bacterium]|nr:transposase [Clostridiaceae bacterium]
MGRASKLSLECWEELFKRYLAGESRKLLSQEYGVSLNSITQGSYRYRQLGIDAFKRRTTNQTYSAEFKRQVLQEYLVGGISLFDLTLKYGIPHKAPVQRWLKEYNSHGGNLKQYQGGRNPMTKGRKTTCAERIEIVGYCIEHASDYQATAAVFQVSYNQVYAWTHKYKERGISGLKDNRGRGRELNDMTELERTRAELKLLEAKNRQLQMENDVLKKADEIERGLISARFAKKRNTKQ